jgi:hypothetical protein
MEQKARMNEYLNKLFSPELTETLPRFIHI